jgi:hypothetical protein
VSQPTDGAGEASLSSLGGHEASWDFLGWSTAERIDDLETGPIRLSPLVSGVAHNLGVWRSSAICGNDITSSWLYVTAIAAFYAGPYAPLALALVAGVLFLFRGIYAEVGPALPLNGGAYNVLLNPRYVQVFLLYFSLLRRGRDCGTDAGARPPDAASPQRLGVLSGAAPRSEHGVQPMDPQGDTAGQPAADRLLHGGR